MGLSPSPAPDRSSDGARGTTTTAGFSAKGAQELQPKATGDVLLPGCPAPLPASLMGRATLQNTLLYVWDLETPECGPSLPHTSLSPSPELQVHVWATPLHRRLKPTEGALTAEQSFRPRRTVRTAGTGSGGRLPHSSSRVPDHLNHQKAPVQDHFGGRTRAGRTQMAQ